jgi:hypothetical protein
VSLLFKKQNILFLKQAYNSERNEESVLESIGFGSSFSRRTFPHGQRQLVKNGYKVLPIYLNINQEENALFWLHLLKGLGFVAA